MLRAVVPKPELKYHNVFDGAWTSTSGFFTGFTSFNTALSIPQGTQLGNRIGDSVYVKMIEIQLTMRPRADDHTKLQVSGGAAGYSNVLNAAAKDQAIRFVMVDTNFDKITNLPVQGLELMGTDQGTYAPGGASDWHRQLDRIVLKQQDRLARMDRKIYLGHAAAQSADAVTPATGNASFGLPVLPGSKEFGFTLKFPGRGLKLQYDGNSTTVPVRLPAIYAVGKNAGIADNPEYRLRWIRTWFTDP